MAFPEHKVGAETMHETLQTQAIVRYDQQLSKQRVLDRPAREIDCGFDIQPGRSRSNCGDAAAVIFRRLSISTRMSR
jgi:hypothetical protein